MNMPGFTAGASLYKTKGHYQREATRVGPRGNNEIIVQSQVKGLEAAQKIWDLLKIGHVVCVDYCEGNMGGHGQQCGLMRCYWWPY